MPVCPSCHDENPQLGAACLRCKGYHYVPEESVQDAKDDPRIGAISAEKYVVLGLINEGGMGAVYRALQLPVEREVAIKVLRTELTDSDQAGDRFIREARAVSRLNHPNIITLFDFGFDSNRHPYMVMEYAPGDSLARWVLDPKLTIERIVNVVHQILSALSEAHAQGIVHRDLKPDNMIVLSTKKKKDVIKLLDFGIARIINEGATRSLTREGEVFGTPHYMAPEQAQGKKNVGPPADVYAMGIMLYEMLVGTSPFDAPTPLAVLFMHINEPLPKVIPRAGMLIPDALLQVLEKATRKNPTDRYQDAEEMLLAVEDVVSSISSFSNVHDITGEIKIPSFARSADDSMEFANAKTEAIPSPLELEVTDVDLSYEDIPNKSNKALWIVLLLLLLGIGGTVGAVILLPENDSVEENPEVVEKEIVIEVPENKEEIKKDEIEKDEKKEEIAKIEPEIEKVDPDEEKKALENTDLTKKKTNKTGNKKKKKKKKKFTKKIEKKPKQVIEKKQVKKKKKGTQPLKFHPIKKNTPLKFNKVD